MLAAVTAACTLLQGAVIVRQYPLATTAALAFAAAAWQLLCQHACDMRHLYRLLSALEVTSVCVGTTVADPSGHCLFSKSSASSSKRMPSAGSCCKLGCKLIYICVLMQPAFRMSCRKVEQVSDEADFLRQSLDRFGGRCVRTRQRRNSSGCKHTTAKQHSRHIGQRCCIPTHQQSL